MEEQPLRKLRYDVASVLNPGRRAQQEDALAADFPHGGDMSFAVLSDGMGGHAAGEIASKIGSMIIRSNSRLPNERYIDQPGAKVRL